MSGAAFLITRTADPTDPPATVRQLLRNALGSRTIREAIRVANGQDTTLASLGSNGSFLTIADDAVFTMIGNTDELYDECKATTASSSSSGPAPLWNMGTVGQQQLSYYHDRISVSSLQDDTVLMVASNGFWGQVDPVQHGWTKSPKQPNGALAQFFDDGTEPSIPRVVRAIKQSEG
jgi:hypothetical protein